MTAPETLLRRLFPPMLATLADGPPPDDENWTYELKYDGFRAVAAISEGRLVLWSRNEIDLAGRFPRIAQAVERIKESDVVLDGEIVALDEKGAPRFQLLQQGRREVIYFFDILWRNGEDLRRKTYEERRTILEKVLKRPPALVDIAQRFEVSGEEALKIASAGGLEGIIAKRKSSLYESRRSKEWLKVKALNEQELIVIGWQPSSHSSKEVGSLHLAVIGDNGKLRYAGKVGTGFSYKQRVWFKEQLSKDVIPASPASDAPRIRDATWVKPRLVAQVHFTEWTAEGRLRHPSFLGLRDDKSPGEVIEEKPMPVNRTAASRAKRATTKAPAAPARVTKTKGAKKKAATSTGPIVVNLSNPDRLLYPRDGITKTDVAEYYEAVTEPMLVALKDRPLTLEHWNQGIDQPSWYHHNIGKEGPPWLTLVETPTRTGSRAKNRHLIADRPEALRWLAQMSVLTVHMWHSRTPKLNEPDWVVFDLDPAKGKGIEQAVEAALVMRKLLENLELPSVPKTSGKRGIHIFVPLAPGYTHEQAGDFAFQIAAAIAARVPDFTVERSLAQRKGRLYLDAMQNAYGKTIVAPYTLRAIDGAPVSAPLQWSEVTKKLDPLKFNLRTMPKRLDKVGDLFAEVFKKRAKLPPLK